MFRLFDPAYFLDFDLRFIRGRGNFCFNDIESWIVFFGELFRFDSFSFVSVPVWIFLSEKSFLDLVGVVTCF